MIAPDGCNSHKRSRFSEAVGFAGNDPICLLGGEVKMPLGALENNNVCQPKLETVLVFVRGIGPVGS
jgi:hypothetical protein